MCTSTESLMHKVKRKFSLIENVLVCDFGPKVQEMHSNCTHRNNVNKVITYKD